MFGLCLYVFRVQDQVHGVINLMKDNVSRVLERGEKLEDLEERSGVLPVYKISTHTLKKKGAIHVTVSFDKWMHAVMTVILSMLQGCGKTLKEYLSPFMLFEPRTSSSPYIGLAQLWSVFLLHVLWYSSMLYIIDVA